MANPPDFRDLDRLKTNKSLEFASFKKKIVDGVGSRVGSGKPPGPPPSPTRTPTTTPTPSVSLSQLPASPTPSPTSSVTPTPSISITSSPAALPNLLHGPGSQSNYGVLFIALHEEGIYFNNDIESVVPASMDIYYNDELVATCTFDISRVGTPFKFVTDYSQVDPVYYYGNFVDGGVYFTGGPQPTPSNTPTLSLTPTISITPSPTETPAPTLPGPTPTPTISITPTISETPTPTLTPEVTPTSTPEVTPTNTPPPSRTPTISVTPTNTPSMTDGASPTPTPTNTLTPSPTLPYVDTFSPNTIITSDGISEEQYFIINYGTVTGNPQGNFTIEVNSNDTSVFIEAFYLDNSGSPYGTVFLPSQETAGTSVCILTTFYDVNEDGEFYVIVEPPDTDEPHWILPELGDFQVLFRVVVTSGEVGTYNWSINPGAFVDINTTPTPTPSPTPSSTPEVTSTASPTLPPVSPSITTSPSEGSMLVQSVSVEQLHINV